MKSTTNSNTKLNKSDIPSKSRSKDQCFRKQKESSAKRKEQPDSANGTKKTRSTKNKLGFTVSDEIKTDNPTPNYISLSEDKALFTYDCKKADVEPTRSGSETESTKQKTPSHKNENSKNTIVRQSQVLKLLPNNTLNENNGLIEKENDLATKLIDQPNGEKDGNDHEKEANTEDKPVAKSNTGTKAKKPYRQRVLILMSRRANFRQRHLLEDLINLFPHSKKESKFSDRDKISPINELCEMNNCNNVLFLECKKEKDTYMWLSKAPNGPSVKFLVENMHTSLELNFFGNCLKGSRPILSFDKNFDEIERLKTIKLLFQRIFAVPRTSKRIKPFIDHVYSFSWADNRIWFRNYQIIEGEKGIQKAPVELVEIGPRFTLNIIKILGCSLYGNCLYQNEDYVSPSQIRSNILKETRIKSMQRHRKNTENQGSAINTGGIDSDEEPDAPHQLCQQEIDDQILEE